MATGLTSCGQGIEYQLLVSSDGGWTYNVVPFAELHNQPTCSVNALPLKKSRIYNVHFQVTGNPSSKAPDFDLGVARVEFYREAGP